MLLTLTDRRGYVYTTVLRDQSKVWVHEGAAKDEGATRQLLAGLIRMALDRGLPEIQMGLPPDHPLVRMALLYGATQSHRPAIHGMAAVALWEPLLPPRYQVVEVSSNQQLGQGAGHGMDREKLVHGQDLSGDLGLDRGGWPGSRRRRGSESGRGSGARP